MSVPASQTIAVIGATGTVGAGLMPLLEADPRATRVIGLDSDDADVRDEAAITKALAGADVVVHLAFDTTGAHTRANIHAINVEGTLNAVRAARAAGARRFVFASSVAAYGFHADNPTPLTEDWPTRPSDHFFYARQKAELESALTAEAGDLELYLVRPAIVLGPHPAGAKLPGPLAALTNRALRSVGRSPVPLPAPVPDFPFQVVHEDDLGHVFAECALGDAPAGAYNAAADGVLTGPDVARELGLDPRRDPAAGHAGGRARRLQAAAGAREPRVGRGGRAAGDHGHGARQARAALDPAPHGARHPAEHAGKERDMTIDPDQGTIRTLRSDHPVQAQGRRLVRADDLGPDQVVEVDTEAHGTIAVGMAGGEPFATGNICRHQAAKLGRGQVRDGCLECPWHRARYDVRTGDMVQGPQGKVFGFAPYSKGIQLWGNTLARLRVFPVSLQDGWIVLD